MLTLMLSLALAQSSPCTEPTDTLQILIAIERAEDAWSMADASTFNEANEAMTSLLPCLDEPLTRFMSARIHRMNGLYHFLNREQEPMELSFAAARTVAPAYRWPADLVPADHPVLDGYSARPLDSSDVTPILPPVKANSTFDGRETLDRPAAVPTIHQLLSEDSAVLGTWLLNPDDPLPDYPRRAAMASSGSTTETRRGARLPMLAGAAGGFAVSGLLYGLAAAADGTYHNGDVSSVAELEKLRSATNRRYWASVGLASASTVTTVGALAIAKW